MAAWAIAWIGIEQGFSESDYCAHLDNDKQRGTSEITIQYYGKTQGLFVM